MPTPIIIEPDELKKHFPGYHPAKSEQHHTLSAKLADRWFADAVKVVPVDVVLLAGGAASGKTEYLSQFIHRFGEYGGIFYDGTLPNVPEVKLRTIRECHRHVEIHFVLPRDLRMSFSVFLNRERKFDAKHFYRTHSASRKTILSLAQTQPDIPIRIIESGFAKSDHTMIFKEIEFSSKEAQIDFLLGIQYSEDEIANLVIR